jgi:uncharacterized protein YutE (UPF0331/DUF86 family)
MDTLIIERKLDSLYRCIHRIEDKCPANAITLSTEIDLQDVVVLNLSRAVQLCVDLAAHILADRSQPPPNTMGETFEQLSTQQFITHELAQRLKKSVGFRNLAVHNYHELDWNIVYAIASRHLGDFKAFAEVISQLLHI